MAAKRVSDAVLENGNGGVATATKPAKEEKRSKVTVLRPRNRTIIVPIKSIDGVPLVINKFSEKAKQMMGDKQQGKVVGPRQPKVPVECYQNAMHLMPGGKSTDDHPDIGFPAGGFRKAMICAAPQVGMKRPQVTGSVFIIGTDRSTLVRIEYDEIRMREDTVRNESGVADLRYRPEIPAWTANLTVQFDESLITTEQVLNLLARAGYSVGIGEARPEKKGDWGRFELDEAKMSSLEIHG